MTFGSEPVAVWLSDRFKHVPATEERLQKLSELVKKHVAA